MNGVKFKSQICTTKIQSQRLLDLGLNPCTSDMCWLNISNLPACAGYTVFKKAEDEYKLNVTPAWSLHRLIEIAEISVEVRGIFVRISSTYYYEEKDNVYDNLIDAISELINNDVFIKEYLK